MRFHQTYWCLLLINPGFQNGLFARFLFPSCSLHLFLFLLIFVILSAAYCAIILQGAFLYSHYRVVKKRLFHLALNNQKGRVNEKAFGLVTTNSAIAWFH